VAARYGYAALATDATVGEMDALDARYWPGETRRPHTVCKLCAFWGPYERFIFLDVRYELVNQFSTSGVTPACSSRDRVSRRHRIGRKYGSDQNSTGSDSWTT